MQSFIKALWHNLNFNTIMKVTKHTLTIILLALLTISCDKDFNTIGEGLVNEIHFDQNIDTETVISTEQLFFGSANLINTPVQTNVLPYNKLGFYNHPVYGETTANVVTEVSLDDYDKNFGSNPVISRVVLSVPYFSSVVSSDSETGSNVYKLDSVYGNNAINLKMFRSSYFLNDFDSEGNQKDYFSNDDLVSLPGLNNQLLYSNENFKPSNSEVLGEIVDGEIEKLSPRLKVNLNKEDFNWLVDPLNQLNISSDSNFKNFYRGLYFEAESLGSNGVLLGLDLSEANIEIFYESTTVTDGVSSVQEDSVKILFSGKKVNLFTPSNFTAPTVNNSSIYLNGGQGAMAIVNIFNDDDNDGNGVSDQLDDLRANNVLINGADLEFYVDQSTPMGGESESERIFLFDIENNRVLLDYQIDNANGSTDSEFAVRNHLGSLQRDANGYGVKYKIDLTEHITNLVRNDSTNVSLGLAVTNDVLSLGYSDLKNSISVDGDIVESIFSASVLTHKGTVLYNEAAVNENKQLKLKIYYTEENE